MKQIRLIWNLVQFKLDKIKQVINECLFLDEDSTSTSTLTSTQIIKNSIEEQSKPKVILKNHPLLEKYFKMLSVGIPKQAVINKMILLNIDYKYLDYAADTDINKLPLDLLNKLQETESGSSSPSTSTNLESKESNKNQDNQNKQDITNVSLLLHLKQKLNKVSDEPSLKIKLLKKNINTNLPVPSLEDIQNARKRILEKNNS
jgi:hypothetical protein